MTALEAGTLHAGILQSRMLEPRMLEASMLAFTLNSLWQIPLILAVACVLARAVRSQGPALEHKVWVLALMLEATLPALSTAPGELLWARLSRLVWSWHRNHGGSTQITVVPGVGYVHGVLGLPTLLLDFAAIAYGASVACFTGLLLYRLWRTRVLRSRAQQVVWTETLAQTWGNYSRHFRVTDADLAVSSEVSGPMTMGVCRRVLLLPAAFTTVLSPEDQGAAMAHEFAHMQRRDYAKNLLYELISLPIAYHPLLWLTRSRIAETREMECDAMAAQAAPGPGEYARSLLRLASVLLSAAPAPNLHAIGIFDANAFERRIMSLTRKPVKVRASYRWSAYGLCIAIGAGTCASAMALRMEVPAGLLQSASSTAADDGAVRVESSVMAAHVLTRVPPVYPPSAKAAGVEGSVVLDVHIAKDGKMQEVHVVSGPAELRQSALDSVGTWTYKPYEVEGTPVAVSTTVTVNYSLQP